MNTLLVQFLILVIGYLVYIAIFTNKNICENMIDLSENLKNKNQFISFYDNSGNTYVMIRLFDIFNKDNNNLLVADIYDKISQSIPDFDKHVNQNSKNIKELLKKYNTQLSREPILLIKSTDTVEITNNKFISGAVRDIGTQNNKKTIIIPYNSTIEESNLHGSPIKNKIIQLDKLLFLDTDDKNSSSIQTLNKIYLKPIYKINNINIYLPMDIGDSSNEIKLF